MMLTKKWKGERDSFGKRVGELVICFLGAPQGADHRNVLAEVCLPRRVRDVLGVLSFHCLLQEPARRARVCDDGKRTIMQCKLRALVRASSYTRGRGRYGDDNQWEDIARPLPLMSLGIWCQDQKYVSRGTVWKYYCLSKTSLRIRQTLSGQPYGRKKSRVFSSFSGMVILVPIVCWKPSNNFDLRI
jgi:hypothetical protein